MGSSNNKGQILIEVGVVMLAIVLIGFAALNNLSKQSVSYQKYKFTQEKSYERKASRSHKK